MDSSTTRIFFSVGVYSGTQQKSVKTESRGIHGMVYRGFFIEANNFFFFFFSLTSIILYRVDLRRRGSQVI